MLAKEYGRVGFDKELLKEDATLEWVTPGHALFEAMRDELMERVRGHLQRGAVFYDLHSTVPYRLDVFGASVKDGRGNVLHRRLFVVRVAKEAAPAPLRDGQLGLDVVPPQQGGLALAREERVTFSIRQPTIFLDLLPSKGAAVPSVSLPGRPESEHALHDNALREWLQVSQSDRERETKIIRNHVEISLNALINRAQVQLAEYDERISRGDQAQGLAGFRTNAELHYDELNRRLESA